MITILWHVETVSQTGEVSLWMPDKNTRIGARQMRDRIKYSSYKYKSVRIVKFVRAA